MKNTRFLKACRRLPVDRTPVWFMRQAGRYLPEYRALREKHSILELAKNPELACEVTLQPMRRFPLDAAILFADILLPIEPLGFELNFAPAPVINNPIRSAGDVSKIRAERTVEKLAFVFEAVRLVRRELTDRPLIGFAGAPFTVASYLIEGGPSRDFVKTKTFFSSEPKAWEALMKKLRTVTAEYLEAQVSAGAQAVQLFDSWAGALSAEQYRMRVLPHSRWIIERLKKTGVPVLHFGTGTSGFLEDFADAGSDVVGVDWRIDLSAAFGRVGPRALQGNLDPALLFAPKSVLKAEVARILKQAKGRKGFIFNVGHGLMPQTPIESVQAVVDWVHQGGSRGGR